jgi:YggT family protein
VSYLIGAIRFVLFVFMLLLLARVVLSLVIAIAHEWKPKGAGLVATEAVFTVTDPPLKLVRRIIPPLTLGQIRLDLAFLVLFFAVSITFSQLARFQ